MKSASHTRLTNRANKELRRKDSKRGNYPVGLSQSQSSSHRPNKSNFEKSRPHRTQRPPWNQPPPTEQISENIFGAFDPYNQAIYPTDPRSYPSMKRQVPYEEIPSEYDGFFPKRSCTYYNQPDNANYTQWDTSYYPPPNPNYPDQTELSKPHWPLKNEPYYDQQQQYSQPEPDYNNQMCM